MTDEETSKFSVSDERTATSDFAEQSASDNGETGLELGLDDTVPVDNESSSDADPAGGKLPDPMMLLSMAAMQLNPAELATLLIPLFDGQARVALGLIANYSTGAQVANLVHAQIAIDSMAFLIGKAGNELDDADRREMQRRLNDLRLNYLERAKSTS